MGFSPVLFCVFFVGHLVGNLVLYEVGWRLWPSLFPNDALRSHTERLRNCRRLVRSVVYCSCAALTGCILWIVFYRSYPHDLLRAWNGTIQVIFHFSCAHWAFSIFEDISCGDAIAEYLNLAEQELTYSGVYKISLFSHHLLAAMCYGWCISTQLLSLLGVIGLCFEAPVICMTLRELYYCILFASEQKVNISPFVCRRYWQVTFLLWHIFRTGLTLLYPVSLIWWLSYLKDLPHSSFVAYNVFCCLFIMGNFRAFVEILLRGYVQDCKIVDESALRKTEDAAAAI
jgi:hypothetical protein